MKEFALFLCLFLSLWKLVDIFFPRLRAENRKLLKKKIELKLVCWFMEDFLYEIVHDTEAGKELTRNDVAELLADEYKKWLVDKRENGELSDIITRD